MACTSITIKGYVQETTGTATGGSTTTLDDSGASWTADEHNGKWLRMTSGSNANEIAVITDNTTTQLTFSPAFSVAVASGDGYEIVDPLDITELYDANKYNDWGEVSTADGINYDIGCPVIVGDGGTTLTFFDLRKNVSGTRTAVNFRFGANDDGLEFNLGSNDRAILSESTISAVSSTTSTGLKITGGDLTLIPQAKDLTISIFNTFINCAASQVLRLLNPTFALSGKTAGSGEIREVYEWDISALEGTNPIENCHIEVWDYSSTQVTDEMTDSQGEITTQELEANYWTGGSATAKTPHDFRFYEYNYTTASPTMAVSSKVTYPQQMTQDPYITKTKTEAGNINASCS